MGFTDEEFARFRELVDKTERPLFLFDDDGDGTTSFAMLYRRIGTGKGVPVKNGPEVNDVFLRKVEEYVPDTIFILDKPRASDDFLDNVSVPVVWLDHHDPRAPEQEHVHYFNPRTRDDEDTRPTSYWTYHFIGRPEDVWIAMTGVVADWHTPDFVEECRERYPVLVPDNPEQFTDYYTHPPLNTLVNLMTFMQKGTLKDSLQAIKVFTRIDDPKEILEQTTARGAYLWKRYQYYAETYEELKQRAIEHVEDGIIVFIYEAPTSFTKELSNDLITRHPGRAILVGRRHAGRIKASLRGDSVDVKRAQEAALEGLDGSGGGHTHSCGMNINADDWDEFLRRYKEALE